MEINKKGGTIIAIIICVIFFINGFNIGLNVKSRFGYPVIELRKELLDLKNISGSMRYTTGDYSHINNKIRVSLESDDIARTIIHEYGHFIYESLMNTKEKEDWDNLCNRSRELPSNYDNYFCNELFARDFTSYLLNNPFPEKEIGFMENMKEKYIE